MKAPFSSTDFVFFILQTYSEASEQIAAQIIQLWPIPYFKHSVAYST